MHKPIQGRRTKQYYRYSSKHSKSVYVQSHDNEQMSFQCRFKTKKPAFYDIPRSFPIRYQVWTLWNVSFLSYASDKQTNRQTDGLNQPTHANCCLTPFTDNSNNLRKQELAYNNYITSLYHGVISSYCCPVVLDLPDCVTAPVTLQLVFCAN